MWPVGSWDSTTTLMLEGILCFSQKSYAIPSSMDPGYDYLKKSNKQTKDFLRGNLGSSGGHGMGLGLAQLVHLVGQDRLIEGRQRQGEKLQPKPKGFVFPESTKMPGGHGGMPVIPALEGRAMGFLEKSDSSRSY